MYREGLFLCPGMKTTLGYCGLRLILPTDSLNIALKKQTKTNQKHRGNRKFCIGFMYCVLRFTLSMCKIPVDCLA